MNALTTAADTQQGRRLNLVLLFIGIMIVAADKTVFAFAGPSIMDELHLSAAEFGMLGSAFFFLYSLAGIGGGLLTNVMQARHVLLLLALIWAVCQFGIAIGTGLMSLIVFRVLLGVGAGPSTAVVQLSCLKWFSEDKRVLPASAINAGLMTGILLSAASLPLIISHWGWRGSYLLLGVVSAVWALLWLLSGREGQASRGDDVPTAEHNDTRWLPYRELLLNRTFIGMSVLCFFGYMASALGFSWTPTYMQKGLALTPAHSGLVVMVIMLLVIPVVLLVSRTSQQWLQRKVRHHVAMVFLPVGCCALGGVAYLLMMFHDLPLIAKVLLLGVGFVLLNVQQSYGIIVCGSISTPRQRGSLIGIHVAIATSAGIVAPMLAGWLVDANGGDIARGYETCSSLVGLWTLLTAVACLVFVRPQATIQTLHGGAEQTLQDSDAQAADGEACASTTPTSTTG
ncbi:MFS transporter [Thalassolituus sp. LLYu03]|uniref:MFS transporter n=1 Tax=Thalassolituus sp. LLYu03 TaxID=3421656 RepID=UPI003D2A5CAC